MSTRLHWDKGTGAWYDLRDGSRCKCDETPDTIPCAGCDSDAHSIGWMGDEQWFECAVCGLKQNSED